VGQFVGLSAGLRQQFRSVGSFLGSWAELPLPHLNGTSWPVHRPAIANRPIFPNGFSSPPPPSGELWLELRESSQADFARRNMLIAAANQCHRTATATLSPDAMLGELKRAIDLLQLDIPPCEPPQSLAKLWPMLRVIEGGLSRI
jgi:hypothetical protein